MKKINILLIKMLIVFYSSGSTAHQKIKIDLVHVDKSERKMHLIQSSKIVKSYDIALGRNPKGHKIQEGDKRTPEGRYFLNWINEKSNYYRSIQINYPNKKDINYAKMKGVNPGGFIMIHGQKNGYGTYNSKKKYDWTSGCIAISNQEIDEFLSLVKIGTPIEIYW